MEGIRIAYERGRLDLDVHLEDGDCPGRPAAPLSSSYPPPLLPSYLGCAGTVAENAGRFICRIILEGSCRRTRKRSDLLLELSELLPLLLLNHLPVPEEILLVLGEFVHQSSFLGPQRCPQSGSATQRRVRG